MVWNIIFYGTMAFALLWLLFTCCWICLRLFAVQDQTEDDAASYVTIPARGFSGYRQALPYELANISRDSLRHRSNENISYDRYGSTGVLYSTSGSYSIESSSQYGSSGKGSSIEGSIRSTRGEASVSSKIEEGKFKPKTEKGKVTSKTEEGSVSSTIGQGSVSSKTGEGSLGSKTGQGSVSSKTGEGSLSSKTEQGSVNYKTGERSVSSKIGKGSVKGDDGDTFSSQDDSGIKSISSEDNREVSRL